MDKTDRSTQSPEQLHTAKVLTNAFRAQQGATVKDWLESYVGKMVDVRFWRTLGGSGWIVEKHVDDATTLMETVEMGMKRYGAVAAVYAYHGRWALKTWGKATRYLDTQAQAEMLAMHNV